MDITPPPGAAGQGQPPGITEGEAEPGRGAADAGDEASGRTGSAQGEEALNVPPHDCDAEGGGQEECVGEPEGEGEAGSEGEGEGEGEGEAPPTCDAFWGEVIDHGGKDVRIDAERVWSGCHVRIGRLTVEAAGALVVARFGGDAGGNLRIEAAEIDVEGLITAVGAGYGGGGGGGGSWLPDGAHCPEADWPRGTPPGSGGGGNAPSEGAAGGAPQSAAAADDRPCPGDGGAGGSAGGRPGNTGSHRVPRRAGRGGRGGGAFGGGGGAPGLPPANPQDRPPAGGAGRPGGYLGLVVNGDETTDRSVGLGSGGGGGGGGAASTGVCKGSGDGGPGGAVGGQGLADDCGGGAGGGGGAAGGGAIALAATGTVTVSGAVRTDGSGDSSLAGGFGAGGGLLIDASRLVVGGAGVLSSLGGGTDERTGGTIKLFVADTQGDPAAVRAGRVFRPAR